MDINQEIENLKVEHQNILKQYNIAHIFLNNTKHHQLQNVYVFLLLLLSLSTTGFVWWNFGYNWFPYLLGGILVIIGFHIYLVLKKST